MNRNILQFLALVFLFFSNVESQQFKFGLKNQTSLYGYEKFNDKKTKLFPISSIYFLVDYKTSANHSIILSLGYNNAEDIQLTGLETEVNVSTAFGKNFFLIGGINAHVNLPSNPAFVSRTIFFLDLGLKYKLSKIFALDLLYYYPLNKTYVEDPKCNPGCNYLVNYSIRFGIIGYFN